MSMKQIFLLRINTTTISKELNVKILDHFAYLIKS